MNSSFLARFAAGLTFFLFLSALVSSPVRAMQSPPQIELSASQASPGATIEVMGGRFPEDAMVEFAIQNTERQISLGTFLADDHGEFSIAALIPVDMQYGEYEFRVTDEKNQVATAPITIVPDASGQEGSDQREDSDGLVAAMPTFSPGVSSTPLSQTAPLETPGSKKNSTTIIYSILAGVIILALLSIRILKKR